MTGTAIASLSRKRKPSKDEDGPPGRSAKKFRPMSTFPFLKLPPELRNKIFELALTANNGTLRLHEGVARDYGRMRTPTTLEEKVFLYRTAKQPEFNQLKWVNRQLYHETDALELRFNDILIARVLYSKMNVDNQLLAFEKRCTLMQSRMLNTITLNTKAFGRRYFSYPLRKTDLVSYERVGQFCLRHSQIKVRWILDSFSLQPGLHTSFFRARALIPFI
jgi:hypothetical protein